MFQFLEPLQSRRTEHEKMRKSLKDWWHKELKRMHDEVDRLRKARTVYIQRQQEWERCRDAARIAEQGAELGATGENKVSSGWWLRSVQSYHDYFSSAAG